jgi:type IV secretion system protein TrbL
MNMAMSIGSHAGGGYQALAKNFTELRIDCEAKVVAARASLSKMLAANSGLALTEADFAVLANSTALSIDEVQREANKYGITLLPDDAMIQVMSSDYFDRDSPAYKLYEKNQQFRQNTSRLLAQQFSKNKSLHQAAVNMKALDEVLYAGGGADGAGGSKVASYVFNPYIIDGNGKQSNLLSPGGMIKVGVMLGDILIRMATIEVIPDPEVDWEAEANKNSLQKLGDSIIGFGRAAKSWFTKLDRVLSPDFIFTYLIAVLMAVGIVASVIFFMIQYVMCIFEYYIVTSIGFLFIPFVLWDATKSYAAKLVTLFTSFFIKIMVMVLCVYFVLGAYIKMGQSFISSPEPISLGNFAYFLFTCILGFVVTQNAPQIAVTMLNGSPQLSMGEFLKAAGTAAAGAVMAQKASQAAIKAGVPAVQAGGRGVMQTAANVQGAMNAVQSTMAGATGMEKFTAGASAFMHKTGQDIGAGMKAGAVKAFTGKEAATNESNARYGKADTAGQNTDKSSSFSQASEASQQAAESLIKKQQADKAAPQKPSLEGKRQ